MTKREKILRDALDIAINEIQSFDCDINDEGIIFNCTQRLLDALKEADEIKDGASEEEEEILLNNMRHLREGGTLSSYRVKWMAVALKRAWGME